MTGIVALTALEGPKGIAQDASHALNVARVAVPSSLTALSENKISALNDGFSPENSFDRSHGLYALRRDESNESTSSWVQYEWTEQVSINKVEVYWAVDHPKSGAIPGSSSLQRMQVPQSYRILYWNGSDFVPVAQPQGLRTEPDTFNATTFEPVKTSKLRLEVVPQSGGVAGILEWKVFNYGPASSASTGR